MILSAFGFLAVLGLVALWRTVAGRDDSLARLQRSGEIRIGYAAEEPYAFVRPGGEVTGEAPEIAKVVVARLGIARISWRLIAFEELISELEAGRIDVIAAAMFITRERARQVRFSIPTFQARQALLVAPGNPLQLHSYQDAVAHPTARIALLAGSVEAPLLRLLGLPGDRRIAVPDAITGRVAVESGLADGLALSSPTVRWMVRSTPSPTTEIAQPFRQTAAPSGELPGEGAFAFRHSDLALHAAWNQVLQGFLGSREHRTLVAGFGFTPDELPRGASSTSIAPQ
ncbi:MAG: transporter substrate-binding domain-containing protein [Verrucomicrobia bacterium]|nr:transporter substrate-binding domain-containing protein [Verrucomicrobiota bacterium]